MIALGALATAGPGVAAADSFTASAITTPANGAELFYDGDSGSGSLNLQGTVTGATDGSKGDLYCYSSGDLTPTKVETGIDVSTGSFSLDTTLAPIAGQACQLALVPAGTMPIGPAALAPFTGPQISVSEQYSRSASGNQYSYYVLSGQLQWSFALQSLGDCPVIASYATDPGSLGSYSLFGGEACLPASSGISPTFNSRSALQVDGLNAYPPAAISSLANESGFQPLSYTATFANSSDDGVTVDETDVPMVCAPPGGYPPTPAVCPSLSPSGVSVQQSTTIVPGGQIARVTQTYTSADHHPHSLDLLLHQTIQAPAQGEFPGFEFPGQTQFAAHAAPDSFTLFPTGARSILVMGDSIAAPSTTNPIGAITYSTPPHDADFISAAGASAATMVLHYIIQVPATGSVSDTWSYTQSDTPQGIQSLEANERDRYVQPSIHQLVPKAKSSTTAHRTLIVRGRVSDRIGIEAVTVDGLPSLRGSTNTFRHRVQLKPGTNLITVTATNFGGNTVTVTRRVDYAPNARTPRTPGKPRKPATGARHRRAGRSHAR